VSIQFFLLLAVIVAHYADYRSALRVQNADGVLVFTRRVVVSKLVYIVSAALLLVPNPAFDWLVINTSIGIFLIVGGFVQCLFLITIAAIYFAVAVDNMRNYRALLAAARYAPPR
jgi:hypothetical protein